MNKKDKHPKSRDRIGKISKEEIQMTSKYVKLHNLINNQRNGYLENMRNHFSNICLFIYFYFWLRRVLVTTHGIFPLWCAGSSLCSTGFSLVVARRLQRAWAL